MPEMRLEGAWKPRWEDALQTGKLGEPLAMVENVRLILLNDPELKGKIAVSDFDGRRYARGGLPWEEKPHLWNEGDDAGLRWYLEDTWGFTGRSVLGDGLEMAARQQRFHPVREYLESLTWDGVARLDTMLIDYLKAEDTPYVRTVSRKWMAAGCRRILEPGCKFDAMLVLVSPGQGRGKSLLGDILAGEWFKDGIKNIENKDALQELQGKWIVELGELSGTRKSSNEAIKQFLSCRKDTFRPSYGRYALDHPRQCIFLGSTNEREFITDETGARRFWPVEIHADAASTPERMRGLRQVRDQLWAEAMVRCRGGETLYLDTAALMAAAEQQQRRFSRQDELVGLVQGYLERRLPKDWENYTPEARRAFIRHGGEGTEERMWVSIAEIRYELLGEEIGDSRNNVSSRALGRIMNVMEGWRLGTTRNTPFGRQKGFVRCK